MECHAALLEREREGEGESEGVMGTGAARAKQRERERTDICWTVIGAGRSPEGAHTCLCGRGPWHPARQADG